MPIDLKPLLFMFLIFSQPSSAAACKRLFVMLAALNFLLRVASLRETVYDMPKLRTWFF